MSVQLLETRIHEGNRIRAVTEEGILFTCHHCYFTSSKGCNFFMSDNRSRFRCSMTNREDQKSVIWLKEDDALKARIRGKL